MKLIVVSDGLFLSPIPSLIPTISTLEFNLLEPCAALTRRKIYFTSSDASSRNYRWASRAMYIFISIAIDEAKCEHTLLLR
jgi:hypothetical protein